MLAGDHLAVSGVTAAGAWGPRGCVADAPPDTQRNMNEVADVAAAVVTVVLRWVVRSAATTIAVTAAKEWAHCCAAFAPTCKGSGAH